MFYYYKLLTRFCSDLKHPSKYLLLLYLVGANLFGFYAVKIFRQTFAGMNPHGGAIAVCTVQLFAAMLSGLLIDVVGRIPLLIISSILMSLALTSFGSYIYYEQKSKMVLATAFDLEHATASNDDWIPLLCVLIFTIAFSLGEYHIDLWVSFHFLIHFSLLLGISPISTLLVGELFPLEYRSVGSSIVTSFSYFCAFLSVKTFVDFQVNSLCFHYFIWFIMKIISSICINIEMNYPFVRKYLGCTGYFGCMQHSLVAVCYSLYCLYQKPRAKIWKKWTRTFHN